ncbi:MAG: hypothetical protein D6737_18235 [Chloroflexi bacterium]|nr:MAG: hypothetical protein D6737_18235 [Chloroflexota bacterium]
MMRINTKSTVMTAQARQRLLDQRAALQQQIDDANNIANVERCLHCGVTDNPTFHEAVRRAQMLHSRLVQIDSQLARAEVVADDATLEEVVVGTRVTVEVDGEQETYIIGSDVDSRPHDGIVSHTSPFGRALIGQRTNASVEVAAPGGTTTIRILKIEPVLK